MAKHPILITEKRVALHSSKGIQLMPTEWTRKTIALPDHQHSSDAET